MVKLTPEQVEAIFLEVRDLYVKARPLVEEDIASTITLPVINLLVMVEHMDLWANSSAITSETLGKIAEALRDSDEKMFEYKNNFNKTGE